jgi:hypothetical protein
LRPLDATGSAAMRMSGAAAVAGALGLRVGSAQTASRGAIEVRGDGRLPLWVKALQHAWVVVGLPTFALVLVGLDAPGLVVGLTIAVGVLLLISLATSLVLAVGADRALTHVELPADPVRPRPTVPASRAHVRTSLVSAGSDWLVVRDEHGREGWTPGPTLGGVRTAQVRGSWLAFEDEQGTALQRLWWPAWGDVERLEGVLASLAARGYAVPPVADGPVGPLWSPPPRIGDGVTRERDAVPQAVIAGSVAPFVLILLLDAAGDQAFTLRGAVLIGPAVLAVVLGLVAAARAVGRVRALKPHPAAALTSHLRRSAP